jgi:hypothetical protein
MVGTIGQRTVKWVTPEPFFQRMSKSTSSTSWPRTRTSNYSSRRFCEDSPPNVKHDTKQSLSIFRCPPLPQHHTSPHHTTPNHTTPHRTSPHYTMTHHITHTAPTRPIFSAWSSSTQPARPSTQPIRCIFRESASA